MATITLRSVKGSALTFAEGDANFTNLNDDKIELTDLSVTQNAASGTGALSYSNVTGVIEYTPPDLSSYLTSYTETDPVVGAINGLVKANGAGTISAAVAGTDYLASETFTELSQDSTPQLGGNLDVNGNDIVSVSNGNIDIVPNGTGKTNLNNITYSEAVYTGLSTSGTLTPDPANGPVQTVSLTGNITINALGGTPAAGDSVTVIIDTNGTSRTLTSTMLFAGGSKTLSTTDTTDILTIFYDGTTYYASLATNFS